MAPMSERRYGIHGQNSTMCYELQTDNSGALTEVQCLQNSTLCSGGAATNYVYWIQGNVSKSH